jgi:ABC-type sugar transport system substrate-binding protein
MLQLYAKMKKTPKNITVLSGGMNADNMLERIMGFKSVMDGKANIEVLNSFEMPDVGKELINYSIAKNKNINGIQLIWGVPVLNGVDSIPALDMLIHDGGAAVFFDVSKPLLKYIKDHPNCATMKQDFHAMGHDGVMNLFNAISGKSYDILTLFDVKVIDKSNAAEELKKM